jgi:hypothetical protein
MKVICFSSFTFAYLNRARVLFSTLRRHHPDWHLVALITDRPPIGVKVDLGKELFDQVVYADELGIPDYQAWLFKHDVVEACTAVKGPFVRAACESDADAVIYLDPDTALLTDLGPVVEHLADHDIVLTPHLLHPETHETAVIDNEMSALRAGIYNLGFLAIRTTREGARFADWWSRRLIDHCYDEVPTGVFVDQRWCDHVPAFFERVKILRDPGYNVASWNVGHRKLSVERDGSLTVNGVPLRFWHFTKLGEVADVMTKRYARDNFTVYELWNWYKREVAQHTDERIPARYWAYDAFADGTKIAKQHRVLYRARSDLQAAYPAPFLSGPGTFEDWLVREGMLKRADGAHAGTANAPAR